MKSNDPRITSNPDDIPIARADVSNSPTRGNPQRPVNGSVDPQFPTEAIEFINKWISTNRHTKNLPPDVRAEIAQEAAARCIPDPDVTWIRHDLYDPDNYSKATACIRKHIDNARYEIVRKGRRRSTTNQDTAIGSAEAASCNVSRVADVAAALSTLPDIERRCIELLMAGNALTEVKNQLGLSYDRARVIHTRAEARLRTLLKSYDTRESVEPLP